MVDTNPKQALQALVDDEDKLKQVAMEVMK